MCGLLGLVLAQPGAVEGELLRRAGDALAHRGPDDSGWLASGPTGVRLGREVPDRLAAEVVLVHRRLSILDLSEAGRQPMQSRDGRFAIVLNGEIYNYVELRRELEAVGETFRSRSDTEVLLAAYARWGPAALERLVGMFAFAVLDLERRTLFLARDPFGIKPLYYARWRDGLAFASEIGPLLLLPGVGRRLNPQRLYEYLRFTQSDHGGETFFAHVAQLPSAHCVEISLDRPAEVHPVRYWRLDLDAVSGLSLDEAAGRLRELFLESVELHLRSDVPLGAALSGGIDSSSIVMAMRHLCGDRLDLHTFSYVAAEPSLDESRWIDVVVGAARTSAHRVRLGPHDLAADFDTVLDAQGEPLESTNIYAQYRVFALARDAGVKVLVNGEGADELLAGYDFFLTARLASLVRQGRWVEAVRFARQAARQPRSRGLWRVLSLEGLVAPRWIRETLRPILADPLVPSWLNRRWLDEHGVVARPPTEPAGPNVLRERLALALLQTRLPRLLRYGDRNSMAFSIESRVPFLTPALASFVLSLPEEHLLARDGTSKAVFRQAMRGLVPDPVLDRRDKIGFMTPQAGWLLILRPWVDRILAGADPAAVPMLDLAAVRRAWAGDPARADRPGFGRTWRCVNVIRWASRFGVEVDA